MRKQLAEEGHRVELETRSEQIGDQLREAQMQKIPYMLIVGQKEQEEGKVSVRSRGAGDEGQKSLAEFVEALKAEIASKSIRTAEAKEGEQN